MTEHNSNKKIRLEKPVPEETIKAISRDTLQVGGLVGPAAPSNPNIGDKMPDGTVFAGISQDTKLPFYVLPEGAPLTMTFNDAKKYAVSLDAHSHRDWRLPTRAELLKMFNNRAVIGGFDQSSIGPPSDYFSSEGFYGSGTITWSGDEDKPTPSRAYTRNFNNGREGSALVNDTSYTRRVETGIWPFNKTEYQHVEGKPLGFASVRCVRGPGPC
jgi:hypothetical protein